MAMIHKGALDTIMMKCFDQISNSDSSKKAFVKKVHTHPTLTQHPAESTGRKIERSVKNGVK